MRYCAATTEVHALPTPALPLSAAPTPPGVPQFACIAGVEALVRGSTLAAFPLLMYRAWGDAQVVSELYFAVGILSLLTALAVPPLAQRLQRRRVYAAGLLLYLLAAGFGMLGGKWVTLALLCNTMAAATSFVCFNAYVLDHVAKTEFARLESLRMFYGGLGWVLGPVLGVQLLPWWHGAPFLMAGTGAAIILAYLVKIRLGNGRQVARMARSASNPMRFLRRFALQPRLIGGWLFAMMRSCGWWFYFVYVGIFAVQQGLGDSVGGVASSLANMGLFAAPWLYRLVQRHSLRRALRGGFLLGGLCFIAATLLAPLPWATVAVLVLGSYCLELLDVCAGLPFLMAVKPSERTEMSAVYSSFRDVSGILSPALAWLVLQFSPVSGVFAAGGCALLLAWVLAGQLHPQLGVAAARRVRSARPQPGL